MELGVTGKTRHADSALIRHVLILSIEVSLFAFISLSKITHLTLTFDQSFWLSLPHCVLGHVLLVRPLACVLNAVKTDIGVPFPAWHGQGMPLIYKNTRHSLIRSRNPCDCRRRVSHVPSCCAAYSSKRELRLLQRPRRAGQFQTKPIHWKLPPSVCLLLV